jgi:uncharacterized protein (TIGR02265 family)
MANAAQFAQFLSHLLYNEKSMDTPTTPTIRGIFVNSHIREVEKEKGEKGLRELERKYGKPLEFKNSDHVAVREEIKIIEAALQVLSNTPVPQKDLAFEAGRLHFKNFSQTPLGKIIFSAFRKNFKLMMMNSKHIAEHVFRGVRFTPTELGPQELRIIMDNSDYPIDHFRGLFQEWMNYSGLKGTITGTITGPRQYEYHMEWQ